MNKSIQPCNAGIKKRRAVQGQASLFTNYNISKSTSFSIKNNRILVKKALFVITEIVFFSAISVFDVVALLGDKQ